MARKTVHPAHMPRTNLPLEQPDAWTVQVERDTPPPTPWVRHDVCARLGSPDRQMGIVRSVKRGNTVMHMPRQCATTVETKKQRFTLVMYVCALQDTHGPQKPKYAKLVPGATTKPCVETMNVKHVDQEAQQQSWARWNRVVALRMWVIPRLFRRNHTVHVT
jgi:hypothetical protein